MKYYIIAGEPSGDLHGAKLISAIKRRQPQAEFRVWGGDKMTEAGAELVTHYREMAFMGFLEVIKNIFTILGLMRKCKSDLLAYQPDLLILIDYPGFNMRMATFAKKNNIKVAYYIAPQVWAWKAGRVKKLKETVDLMMTILPFEKSFYAQRGMDVEYVGHPLIDHLAFVPRENMVGDNPTIALLPGSRKQEIEMILPEMLKLANAMPNANFLIGMAPSQSKQFYEPFMTKLTNVSLYQGETYDLMREADAGLVTSGTATLEAALLGLPQVVCYKTSAISYMLARYFIKVKYISLVNLIADREIVRERIQENLNQKVLLSDLKELLYSERRSQMAADYKGIRNTLGAGASDKAAKLITSFSVN
ncbi:MAG: lipid-A-disaccharide synthase [Cryomorphaceae bacterium]|nr:lipid-A-disaccharide synthase [Cryomorphaceae bacterium]